MGNIGKEVSYGVFLIISVLTYFTEISLNCVLAYYLWIEEQLVWFALLLCLIIVPCIAVQLVSYHKQTTHSKRTCAWEVPVVFLHIFQLALPWRYGRLFLSHRISLTSKEIWEIFLLRTLHTFFSSLPVFVIQVYLILAQLDGFDPKVKWYLVTSASTSIFSIAWILATYQKYQEYCCVIGLIPPWTAILIKLIWRIGELFSRILTVGLFAVAHGYWVFLVIGFHWLTMLLVLIVDRVLQISDKDKNLKSLAHLLLKSYIYVFTHLNITSRKAKYGFVFFYIICCLESVALLTLWILYEKKSEYHIPFGVAVAGGYALALIFALIYYNCFHKAKGKHSQSMDHRICQHQCADCRLDHCDSQISGSSSSKPWLQVTSNPNPQFFDMLQSHDCNSDRSSELIVGNGVAPAAKTKMLTLDARTLNERSPARSGHYSDTQNSGILEWDDYDLQIRETPEGASMQDRDSQVKESPRSSTNSKGPHSRQTSIADQDTIEVLDSPRGTLDQGYFSGISASSIKDQNKLTPSGPKQIIPIKLGTSSEKQKEAKPASSNEELLQSLKQHKTKKPHHHHGAHNRQHSASGVLSDSTTASAYSSASSKRPILNCERCGHCVAIDSVSLYSVTSTSGTSMASSHLYGKNNRLRPGSVDLADRSAVLKRQQKRSKSAGNRAVSKRCVHHTEMQLPLNVARRSLYAYTNPVRIHSDATSSGWECTDSEI